MEKQQTDNLSSPCSSQGVATINRETLDHNHVLLPLCSTCLDFDDRLVSKHGIGVCRLWGKAGDRSTGPNCSCDAHTPG